MSNAPSSAPPSPSPAPAPTIEVVGGVGGGGGGGGADIIPTDPPAPHKLDDGGDGSPLPPALPPRPPPRPRGGSGHPGAAALAQLASADQLEQLAPGLEQQIRARVLRRSCWLRKYVFLCTACGGLAVLLGALFLTVYFMLRSYTSSLNYFETVPTYVPAAMLIVTGLIVMCLAGRRNRYGYLIKLCGGCCLACAILCVIVTITTTVIHMNRLQMLRECVYTRITQTCTCYPVPIESTHTGRAAADMHYVFNSTPDCEVIHGALYSCLRAMFGLSVIGILVCIFSCMLIYQLLSHEKKKMYWEQLEMRCRYLYRQQRNPHHCTCCDECRYPPPHQLFPWEVMDDRYWTPGRVGNLYSPNPGEDGGTGAMTLATQRLRGGQQQERTSGWSWRRLPWSRSGSSSNTAGTTSDHIHRDGPGVHGYRHTTSSPDSQYGFSSHPTTGAPGAEVGTSPTTVPAHVVEGSPGPYGIPHDPHHHSTLTQARPSPPQMVGPFMTEGSVKAIQQQQPPPPPPPGAAYGQQYYLWGPPPPYSGNNSHCNSPARRAGTGGTGEPILNLLHHPPGSAGPNTGSPSRLQHYQHHHHMHHHHHHCQMNQQLAEQQNAGGVLVQGLMKNLQNRHLRGGGPISSAAARRFQQDQRQQTTRYDEFSSSSGDCVVVSDCGGMEKGSVVIENYVNTGGEATLAGLNTSSGPGGDESTSATTVPSSGEGNSSSNVTMPPSDSSSLVTGNKDSNNRTSNNTLPASARKVKKRVEMPKTLGNIPQNFSSEQQIPGSGGSQKSSPSHFPVGSGNNNNSYPTRANVPMIFSAHQSSQQQQQQQQQQQSCQMQEHYHHPHHPHNNTEMSGDDEEETRLVADKYPHSLPTSSAVVRGKDGVAVSIAAMGNTGNAGGNGTGGNLQGYHGHHHQTMQGVSNAGFQGQEEDDDEEEGHQHPHHHHHHSSQMICGSKSEPTESEVYFADVSSCCNVSVRNDGQDSSLYDEALDPQKHRLVMLGQNEQGGHLQRLPEAYQMSEKVPTHHHHHNSARRFLPHQQGEVIVGMPPASHHQYHQHQTDLSSDHHHLTVSDEENEEQLTSNCFSYQRQTSTRTRLPFPLPTHHHHLSEQDSSTVEEDLPEGLMGGHGMVVGGGNGSSSRDFIDAENVRKGIGSNTRLSESSKDLSQQQATPTDNIDGGGYLMSSPMSISASSPGSFPTGTSDDLDNCGSYYDNHHGTAGNNNNSSDVGSSSGSTSAVCSPLSNDTSSNIVMFGSPSSGHGYPIPSPQKLQYDQQGNRLLHHQHLHQQCGGNNNYHPTSPGHEQTTDFSHHHHQVHHPGGDQHFLAPDAQYETIPHHQPSQNTATNPQGYHPTRHLQNFSTVTQRSDDYNGNTPSNSPGKGGGNRGPPGGPVGITSPARRRLNLPLHHVTTGPLNNNGGGNLVENLYHTATSTEEDESESHQPQSSSYSDATMDSGCHSGSEFAARRQRGSNRGKDQQQRTGVNVRTQVKDEERSLVEEVVPAMRSVNV